MINLDEVGTGVEHPCEALATEDIADGSRVTELVEQRDGVDGLINPSRKSSNEQKRELRGERSEKR